MSCLMALSLVYLTVSHHQLELHVNVKRNEINGPGEPLEDVEMN